MDKISRKYYSGKNCISKIVPSFNNINYYGTSGPFLLKLSVPKELAKQLDELYQKARSYEDLDYIRFMELINGKQKINLNFEYNESGGEFHFELYPKNTGRVHYIAGDAFIRKNHDGKLNMQYGVKIKGSRRYLENMPLLMLRKKERQEFEKLTERARVPVDITIAPINRGFGDLA